MGAYILRAWTTCIPKTIATRGIRNPFLPEHISLQCRATLVDVCRSSSRCRRRHRQNACTSPKKQFQNSFIRGIHKWRNTLLLPLPQNSNFTKNVGLQCQLLWDHFVWSSQVHKTLLQMRACSLFYRMHVLYHYHQLFIVIDCVSFKENIIYVSFVFDPEINPHSLIVCCFISPTRLVIESMVICVTH